MPAFTLSSTVAAILQFVVIMSILSIVINTHTTSGAGIVPISVSNSLYGVVNKINQSYLNTTDPHSLRVQMANEYNYTSNNINPGIIGGLQALGGLAFLPAAFGMFMNTIWSIPGTMLALIQSLATFQGPYVILPFSAMALSGALMAYYVIEFVFKLFTPITKTEIGDV